jgi:hypothetical protein
MRRSRGSDMPDPLSRYQVELMDSHRRGPVRIPIGGPIPERLPFMPMSVANDQKCPYLDSFGYQRCPKMAKLFGSEDRASIGIHTGAHRRMSAVVAIRYCHETSCSHTQGWK